MTGIPSVSGKYLTKGVRTEKPKSMRHSWSLILRFMRKYWGIFALAMALVFIESLLNVFVPNYVSNITDLIADGLESGIIDLDAVNRLGVLILIIYIFSHGAMLGRNYLMADIAQRVAGDMRTALNRKLFRLPMNFYDRSEKGDIVSRFTNDTDTVGAALNRAVPVFFHAICVFILCLIMMLLTDPILTFVSVIATFFGFFASSLIVRFTQKYYRSQQRNIGSMYSLISEIYSAHGLVLSYSGERGNKKKFDYINENLRTSGFYSEITLGLLPAFMQFAGNIGYVMVCIVGSVMVINGDITIGVVVAFILYEKMFMGPLDMIANSLGNLQAAGAGAERVFEFLESEEMPPDPEDHSLTEIKGAVEFRDVHFGYIPEKETIKGFSVSVKPGQKIAIVGATGAGKTTVVNLLMKFYDVWSGDILIDGVSLKDIPRSRVHSMFCMVLQDTWLFDGTIRENIAYGSNASDEELAEACERVGLDDFIRTLPNGLDTHIGHGGGLSEGQRQQVCISRALVDHSPMMILDEATSMVDSRTEVIIQKAIDSMMSRRSCFVIAHRLSTIINADVILVMKDGNIVEQGRHDDLVAQGGVYADLYQSQFEDGEY